MMSLSAAELRALILAVFLFPLSLSFVPRQDKPATPAPSEETYSSDNNKPTEIKHLDYPVLYPFSIFESHIPTFRIPAYQKVKDQMFGIEPHLRVSGRRKRSMPLGRYFFVQRMMPPQMQSIEYNIQQKDIEPCNVTANENCTDEGVVALDKKHPSWQADKRTNIPAIPSSPINIKARRPYDVPQIEKISRRRQKKRKALVNDFLGVSKPGDEE
ncbi:hypothetical protein AVEN_24149-1 [Araneus ventricosus]|uniref:Uncharacterized protein n=1 Tax=Araneus ventricosus TaxID=182803 RepID=A0A4Y2KFU5_ARAVE|nr:hypothetical protein AVEN_24149-1 [Araneus ventricosus]